MQSMLFMVIETFGNSDVSAVYRRLKGRGRLMPEGLTYVDSWVESNFDRCFQLVECDDPALVEEWAGRWRDLNVGFEIVPVMTSREAGAGTARRSGDDGG